MGSGEHLKETLEDLEGPSATPSEPTTGLIRTCHALRRKPIGSMTAGDLRVLIGQDIGLQYLVPMAIGILEHSPFVEGDYYPGDLLLTVLRADSEFWVRRHDLRSRLEKVMQGLDVRGQLLPSNITQEIEGALREFDLQSSARRDL